jgi:hypothetical protein
MKDKNNDLKSELNIRPINEEEAEKISNRLGQISLVFQTFANALQRQALTNLGTLKFYEGSSDKPKIQFSTLTNGLGSRLLYQGIATYPSLIIRSKLSDETNSPQYVINLATCGTETLLGVIPEVNSSLKTFKLMGIDISKQQLLSASSRVFLPYLCRNGLAWMAINSNTDDSIASKIGHGAGAGFSSVYFHNIGNKVIENTPGKSWQETTEIVMKEISQKPLSFFNGASFRAASIAATALFLAPQTTKLIEEKFSEFYDILLDKGTPSTSPKNPKLETKENSRSK